MSLATTRYARSALPYPIDLVALAALVATLSFLVSRLDPDIEPNLATHAHVSASSGQAPAENKAAIVDGDIWHVGFQTAVEANPYIQLEFATAILISRVVVHSRTDCCLESEVPLAIELSDDGHSFSTVARTDDAFQKWIADIGPRKARFVRVHLRRSGDLILNEIEVK